MPVGRIWPSSGRPRPTGTDATQQAARHMHERGKPVRWVAGAVIFVFNTQGKRAGREESRRRRRAHLGRLGFECGAGIGGEDAGKSSAALGHGGGAPRVRPWLHCQAPVEGSRGVLGLSLGKRRGGGVSPCRGELGRPKMARGEGKKRRQTLLYTSGCRDETFFSCAAEG